MNTLKVAMMAPKLKGHEDRGTGVYARNLLEALNKRDDIVAEFVEESESTHSFDIIHYPYFDPFFLTLPLRLPKPSVVTVHDLIPFNFPEHFPSGSRGKLKWLIQKFSLSLKPAIITDSFASKNDIVRLTRIKPDFVHVIYLGIGKEFSIISPPEIKKQLSSFSLPQKFLLYVGDINYNKNVAGLLQAFSYIADKNSEIGLVLVGKGFTLPTPQRDEIRKIISALNLGQRVFQIGHVNLQQLVALYNSAEVYVQPSFSEGFGLPVLEAMACGTAVVSAHTASLPEIVADAAMLVDPYNPKAMGKIIDTVLTSKQLKEDLVGKGLQRVRQFTWEKCAEETVDIYKSIQKIDEIHD